MKWWLPIILFLATVLTYLDRQTISLCGPMISEEFQLSNEQFGHLLAAFRWTYAFTHLAAGYLADRASITLVYALAVGVWSAAGASAAFVQNARQLIVTRGILGVGEAFNWPCATRITANLLPPEERGLGSGIFNSGAAVGSLLAPLIITPIAIHFGWRSAFFVVGAVGFLWIVLWLVSTRKGTRAHLAVSAAAVHGVGAASGPPVRLCRAVFFHPAFWMLVVVAITVNPCWYFLNEWIPKYMHDRLGMGYLTAGLTTVPIFVGADLGNLLSGGLIKLLTMRGWPLRRARAFTLTLAALLIVPVVLITRLAGAPFAIVLLALAALGITSIVANFTACMQDLSLAHAGLVAGVLGMWSNVFSAVVNPLIGRYVDRTGNYTLIFLLMGILPAISLGAILTFDRMVHGRDASTSC